MTKPAVPTLFQRITTTFATLFAVVVVVLVNAGAYDYVGWIEPVAVCIGGGLGVLAISHLALIARHLLIPAGALVAITAILIGLVWTVPLTIRTRFFADTAQIKVGMPVSEVRARLPQYPMSYNTSPGSAGPEAIAAAKSLNPAFTGSVICAPIVHAYDCTRFEIKDGVVTAISHYLDD